MRWLIPLRNEHTNFAKDFPRSFRNHPFRRNGLPSISNNQPFPEFHHCPYVGLIGNELSRVGCLLHPMAEGNTGVDFRGLSYYGGMACRIYFCPVNNICLNELKILSVPALMTGMPMD
jgi:hypothetical protein